MAIGETKCTQHNDELNSGVPVSSEMIKGQLNHSLNEFMESTRVKILRGRQVARHQAHNLATAGSIPAPAIGKIT